MEVSRFKDKKFCGSWIEGAGLLMGTVMDLQDSL